MVIHNIEVIELLTLLPFLRARTCNTLLVGAFARSSHRSAAHDRRLLMPPFPFPACPPPNRDPRGLFTVWVPFSSFTAFLSPPQAIPSNVCPKLLALCVSLCFSVSSQLTRILETFSNNMATATTCWSCHCGAWPPTQNRWMQVDTYSQPQVYY